MAETGVLLDDRGRPAVPVDRLARHPRRTTRRCGSPPTSARSASRRAPGCPARELCTLAKYAWMRAHRPRRGARRALAQRRRVDRARPRRRGGRRAARSPRAPASTTCTSAAPWDEALAWAGAPDGPDARAPSTPAPPMGRAQRRARSAAPRAPCSPSAATTTSPPRSAPAPPARATCSTRAAPPRRSSAPSRRSRPTRSRRSVAGGVTVGWHAVPGRQALLGAVWSGSALSRVLALLGVPVEERHELEAAALDAEPGALSLHGVNDDELTPARHRPRRLPRAPVPRRARGRRRRRRRDPARAWTIVAGGPARRLVVTGGWAAGEAARAVKREHLGPFEHSPALSTGARGAALAAGRAAGLWTIDDAPRGSALPRR